MSKHKRPANSTALSRNRGGVVHWTIGFGICEALPIAIALLLAAIFHEPDPIHNLIGYSLVMVVAFGLLGAVVVDVIVEGHGLTPTEILFGVGIGFMLVVFIFAGMLMEMMHKNPGLFPDIERLPAHQWLWYQFFISVPAILFGIKTKWEMLDGRVV